MTLERLAPSLFVALWSTGFIVAHYAVLWLIAVVTKAPRLERRHAASSSIVGLLMHATYLGGVFFAISKGLPSGVSALIAGTHPVVTSFVGHWLLKERLRLIQWCGVACGLGGVIAVLVERSSVKSASITTATLIAMILAVLGMTTGTLVQRSRGQGMSLLRGTAMQYVVAGAALTPVAIFNEHWKMQNTLRNAFSVAWAVGVLSIAAVLLMMLLLARHAAAKVSSLFFLTPALSTIEGAILFSERLGALAVAGLFVSLVGVWLTQRNPAMQ